MNGLQPVGKLSEFIQSEAICAKYSNVIICVKEKRERKNKFKLISLEFLSKSGMGKNRQILIWGI